MTIIHIFKSPFISSNSLFLPGFPVFIRGGLGQDILPFGTVQWRDSKLSFSSLGVVWLQGKLGEPGEAGPEGFPVSDWAEQKVWLWPVWILSRWIHFGVWPGCCHIMSLYLTSVSRPRLIWRALFKALGRISVAYLLALFLVSVDGLCIFCLRLSQHCNDTHYLVPSKIVI